MSEEREVHFRLEMRVIRFLNCLRIAQKRIKKPQPSHTQNSFSPPIPLFPEGGRSNQDITPVYILSYKKNCTDKKPWLACRSYAMSTISHLAILNLHNLIRSQALYCGWRKGRGPSLATVSRSADCFPRVSEVVWQLASNKLPIQSLIVILVC